MQTALLRCSCLFLFVEDRGQSGTYTLRLIHHRWVKTPKQLCEAFSSSSEEHLPLHKFCFQKIYPPVFSHFLRRKTERISAFRYPFLSTRRGDIFVWKQRGNREAECISVKLRRPLDYPRAAILTIVALYLKSLRFCSRSWTSVRSSRFSPPLDGRTCRISKA